jgi:putative ABC transport system permease protein
VAFVGTVVRGSLLRRPGRTLSSILGVALGIGIVVAIFTVDFNTIKRAQRHRPETWSADLEVRPSADLSDAASALREIPGVSAATSVYKASVEVSRSVEGAPPPAKVSLIALEAVNAAKMGILVIESGEFLRVGTNDVLVGRALAEGLKLRAGDTIDLARPRRAARKECIDGEYVDKAAGRALAPTTFTVAGILGFENVGRLGGGAVVVIDSGAALELFDDSFLEPNFWVSRDPNVDLERLQAGLGKQFSYNLRAGSAVGQKADERAFRNGVRLAGLMALALGLFVIFHTLSMSLVERVREVAILNALGSSRAQIGRIFFTEALVIALSAGALGLGGGILLARTMLNMGISSLGITDMVVGYLDIPWAEVLGLTGLGIAIALIGSVFPLLRARSEDTVRALRGEDLELESPTHRGFNFLAALLILIILPVVFFALVPMVGETGRELLSIVFLGITVLALLVGTPLLVPGIMALVARRISKPLAHLSPFSGLLASRSIARNPTRIAASVAAIALVTAAFVGLRGLTGSLHYETKLWAAEAVDHKVFLHGLDGASWSNLAAALDTEPGVLGVEPGSARIESPFRIVGIDPVEAARYGPMATDPQLALAFARSQGLILSSRIAVQRGLEVGDVVPIATPSQGVRKFSVLAISDSYGYFDDPHERAYGVMALHHLGQRFCLDTETADILAVRLAPGDGCEATRDRILPIAKAELTRGGGKLPANLWAETGTDIRLHEIFDILRDFLVFDVIILLTLIIAGVGVLNGQLLAAMERFKEFGVLRALGADQVQIRNSVMIESIVIGLTGSLVGMLLGYGLVYIMVDALKLLSGLELPQVGFQWDYLLAALGAFLVTIVAGVYPVWSMSRMDPVRAVRTG